MARNPWTRGTAPEVRFLGGPPDKTMTAAHPINDDPLWLACPCGEPGCAAVCPHQDERGEAAAACDCHCCEAAERAAALELEAPPR